MSVAKVKDDFIAISR